MNITSVLIKKVILESDSETWSRIRKHYLPTEYHTVYSVINKHFEDVGGLPSFDALKLSIRSSAVLDKIYAIESAEDVDLENSLLLEFLKNEYTQEEIMDQLSKYLEESIMMESAKENVEKLQNIIFHIEDQVDLKDPQQDMARMELFTPEEELNAAFALGLNEEYDSQVKFLPGEYILIGGKKGSGKSLTSANIAVNAWNNNASSIYFTIEMSARATLQRMCAMATGIPATSIRMRNLSHGDWLTVAKWWSSRYEGGVEVFNTYIEHNDFNRFHEDLVKKCRLWPEKQLDIVYDPAMTLGLVRSELDKKVEKLKPAVIVVDYINQLKRGGPNRGGHFDWTEQIEISKSLKEIAQQYGIPLVSPYQTDITGEARFAKGILDSCDSAFELDAHEKDDACISFKCKKMRDYDEIDFCSSVDWKSLRIGPSSATPPSKTKKDSENKEDQPATGELPFDL